MTSDKYLIDTVKILPKGQITLSAEMRRKLGWKEGDHLIAVCEGSQIVLMNAGLYAMKVMEESMRDQAEMLGWTEDDIEKYCKEFRDE